MPWPIVSRIAFSRERIVKGLKPYVLCLLSVVLLTLPYVNGKLWFLSWFAFLPFFIALENKNKLQRFWLAYFTGVVFWACTIYWLVHVTLIGMILLVLYLALYLAVFGLTARTANLLVIPSAWVVLEYFRAHLPSGFGWELLGYSQSLNLSAIQIADITGVWGVSFVVMWGNVLLYSLFTKKRKPVLAWLLILLVFVYGYYKLHQPPAVLKNEPVKFCVIQPNIVQELKWEDQAKGFIMQRYLSLSSRAAEENPDLMVWPEAALPVILEEEPEYFGMVRDFIERSRVPLLFGAVTYRSDAYYNSALLLRPGVSAMSRYDKLHLVPFGEYIPFRKNFPFLETIAPIGDMTRGKEYTVFNLRPGVNFSVLICFEDLFPELSRSFVNQGADFLVNITNDAWFQKTTAPFQHLQASIFRAVENRVYLVRSANTGISGFIAPSGRLISLVRDAYGNNIYVSGYAVEKIELSQRSPSLYSQCGDWFVAACLLFLILYFSLYRYLRGF